MKTITVKNKEVTIEMSIGKKGYGQYNIGASCIINGERFEKNFHTTDSKLYDALMSDDSDYEENCEQLFLKVERDLIEAIEETIYQLEG